MRMVFGLHLHTLQVAVSSAPIPIAEASSGPIAPAVQ